MDIKNMQRMVADIKAKSDKKGGIKNLSLAEDLWQGSMQDGIYWKERLRNFV